MKLSKVSFSSIPSSSIKITPAPEGTGDDTIQLIGDNFKNLSMDTEVYFDEDLYHSIIDFS